MSYRKSRRLHAPDPEAQAALARRLRPAGGGVLAIMLALAAGGVLSRRARDVELMRVTREAAFPTVELCAPTVSQAVQQLILPANIEAFVDAPIYARVSGYLKSWRHDIGARVTAGEILGVIEAPELNQQVEQAKGLLARARAEENLARTTARRWLALRDRGAESAQSADEKAGNLEAASAVQSAAKANFDQLQALEAYLHVIAPFDGVVTARNVDVGALIESGAGRRELFRVADVHKMRVYVRVPQADTARIQAGLEGALTLPQYPTRNFPTRLVANAGAIAANSRTLLAQFLADNPDGALLPGAYGLLKIDLAAEGAPLLLPASALVFLNSGPQVATVDEGGVVRMKAVTIARDLGSTLEISAGLSIEDRVVKNPGQSMHDGLKVKVKGEAP